MDKKTQEALAAVCSILSELALEVVTVEPGDLQGLKKLLDQTERLSGATECSELRDLGGIAQALKGVVERLILEETDHWEGLGTLERCTDILQEICQCKKEGKDFTARSKAIRDTCKNLGIAVPDTKEEEVGSSAQEPKPKDSAPVSAISQDTELYVGFISEAKEHLDHIEVNVISLEENPDDKEVIDSIFRPFHTIKGISGFLNLTDINTLAHRVESMLDDLRTGNLKVSGEIIDVILDATDLMRAMIEDLGKRVELGEDTGQAFEAEAFLERIDAIVAGQGRQSVETDNADHVSSRQRRKRLGEIVVEKAVVSQDVVQEALKKQQEVGRKRLGEILIADKGVPAKQVAHALREQRESTVMSHAGAVKIDTYKLDNLVDMVGELVIIQSLIRQNPYIISVDDQKLTRDFSQLARITSDLQKTAMSMRMVPIKQTFQKMIRLVRDLCRKSGKEAELIMSGEETEIDRNMVEAIYDPLVHMIRNTVDHGIEPKEERREKGKPLCGSVQLKAYHKGGNVVIEIEDDGRGLDRMRIRKKAIEKGLVKEDDELSNHEIDNLIFEPGFSTRDSVTDVSGRGVGMDVVKKTIEDLRGKVEIHSTPDRGCLFILKLPLTLAIIDGIIIKVGDQRYILPTIAVQESLRPEKTHYTTVAGKGEMIRIRDNLLPLVRLPEIFHLPSEEKHPWEALVVVAESEGKRKCLLVDELMDKQEVVIKSLGESFRKLKGISGGAIMGDGSVGLILDIPGIFDISEHRAN